MVVHVCLHTHILWCSLHTSSHLLYVDNVFDNSFKESDSQYSLCNFIFYIKFQIDL